MALDLNMAPKAAKKPVNPDDPFQGNGSQKADGGWVPNDHPEAQGLQPAPPPAPGPVAPLPGVGHAPGAPVSSHGQTAASPQQVQDVFASAMQEQAANDPFAAIGGGTLINGGWVPNTNPMAQSAPETGPDPTGPVTPLPGIVDGPPGGGVTPLPGIVDAPTQANPIEDAFRASVLKQLQGGDITDPAKDPRAAAYRTAQKRNQDRAQAQSAESAISSGLIGSGGFEGATRALSQQRGEAEASFEADIAGEQMRERRQDLANSMAIAERLGDRESAESLQREMAQLDAQLQREGYGVTTRGQDIDAALQKEGFGVTKRGQDIQRFGIETSADLDRAQQALSRYGLDLNDKQTAQRLGFDYAQLQELANRQAVLAALG